MTITFRSLWSITLGTFFGALILHAAIGHVDGYMFSLHVALFVGIAHILRAQGWST
jgi:hypothetical protein